MLLTDRIALITGAAGGIGRSVASLFSEEGAAVVMCGHDGTGAEAAAADIGVRTGRRTLARAPALTRSIARDRGPRGIRCNAVCPGATPTPILEALLDQNPELERQTIEAAALKRIAEPIDVAQVVLFLASTQSDHITGEHIVVNGGRCAKCTGIEAGTPVFFF